MRSTPEDDCRSYLEQGVPDAQHGWHALNKVTLAAIILNQLLHNAALKAGGVGGIHLPGSTCHVVEATF